MGICATGVVELKKFQYIYPSIYLCEAFPKIQPETFLFQFLKNLGL